MKRIFWSPVYISTVAFAAALAQPSDVDWKLYGSTLDPAVALCFYNAKDIDKRPDGNIRVWIKCLLRDDVLKSVDPKNEQGKKIVEDTAQKIKRGYVPPIIVLGKMDFDEIGGVVASEKAANVTNLQPIGQIFYEINCKEKMTRVLSAHFRQGGKDASLNTPLDWEYVPPETNYDTLLRIQCR
jgi:hypothetical protein